MWTLFCDMLLCFPAHILMMLGCGTHKSGGKADRTFWKLPSCLNFRCVLACNAKQSWKCPTVTIRNLRVMTDHGSRTLLVRVWKHSHINFLSSDQPNMFLCAFHFIWLVLPKTCFVNKLLFCVIKVTEQSGLDLPVVYVRLVEMLVCQYNLVERSIKHQGIMQDKNFMKLLDL